MGRTYPRRAWRSPGPRPARRYRDDIVFTTRRPERPTTAPVRPLPRALTAVTVLVVLAVGVFVFTWRLGVESSVGDELVYRDAGAQYVDGVFTYNLEHPPLAKYLVGLGHLAFGGTLVADRLPSALLGILTGGVLFAITRRIAGPRAGLLAALLWYVLPLHPGVVEAHVGRQATLEMPLLFFVACALWAAQALLDRATWWRWAWLGVAVGAATATKLTGASVAVVTLALLWRHRATPGRALGGAVLAGSVAVAVFLATYLPFGAEGPDAVRTVVQWQLDHAGRGAVQHVAGVNHAFPPWWSAWWFQARYLTWAGVVALWGLAMLGVVAARRAGIVVATALAGFTLALVASPLKLPQYHDVWMPPLLVGAAVALHRLVTGSLGSRVAAAAAGLVLLALAGQQGLNVATTAPADYRLVGAELRRLSAGSVVVSWADTGALQRYAPDLVYVGGTVPDCTAAALVVDATIADRIPGADAAEWAAQCGASPRGFQRMQVLLTSRAS